MASATCPAPPDQSQRERALDPRHSILVQAPAGSGKTDLLTRRFLVLLAEVEDPSQIVAITFTKAAASEMRHRIVHELQKAAEHQLSFLDQFSMESLAARALEHSQACGWNLLDLPTQLRISTIDSFCRELAVQRPLLSGLGSSLDLAEYPAELYRRAARQTLGQLGQSGSAELSAAIEALLVWRDNNWIDVENQLVMMLSQRDRWMHSFVLDHEPDWHHLRGELERPFARAVVEALHRLSDLFEAIPNACAEMHALAQFACAQTGLHRDLAEVAAFPCAPFETPDQLAEARTAFTCLADMLLTNEGEFRKRITVANGFPADRKLEKRRLEDLIASAQQIPGLRAALHAVRLLPPAHYAEEDWHIIRACFVLLRRAAAELKVAFAEAGIVDFIEVSQLAQQVLEGEDGYPTDAGIAIADRIHHLLVDEFQDTSRRQHKLLSCLVSAWPDASGRTIFVVGDPMQSIYFFRDADAELFPRVRKWGLELANGAPFTFEFVPLSANFRTAPLLVQNNNQNFAAVFTKNDDSDIEFSPSVPVRNPAEAEEQRFKLHLSFTPQLSAFTGADADLQEARQHCAELRESARAQQINEIVDLVRDHLQYIERARASGNKYRIAILGRTKSALFPIADALRAIDIPFRALDLENLSDRPEVRDALSIARALLSSEDRIAWLGMLRAPWCGISLEDLHTIASADDPGVMQRPISVLLQERLDLLSTDGRRAVRRLQQALSDSRALRAHHPDICLGTWLRYTWERLGGDACVDATSRENLTVLWRCLDKLPNDQADLLGDGLHAALANMTAQPDPATNEDCGVQLMTIHKSKGLEFEVVIVPELQSGSGRTSSRMLSWLERGLADPEQSDDSTEFLIAPQQRKGTERGSTKEWVDRVYREREQQETRRILYVAATRAREELHLFARPEFRDKDGERTLCHPTGTILAAAWPAFKEELEERFATWDATLQKASIDLAAEAQVLEMPPGTVCSIAKPALVRRLPDDYEPPALQLLERRASAAAISTSASSTYERHEGNLHSRLLGTAVHTLLEEFTRSQASGNPIRVNLCDPSVLRRLAADVRSAGLQTVEAEKLIARAAEIVQSVLQDPAAQWILAPHINAESEVGWTGLVDGAIRNVRIDRIFRAGHRPHSEGQDVWWIVDYKTAHPVFPSSTDPLPHLRPLFAPQLEVYAQVLRNLHGHSVKVMAGLFYPVLRLFDWWEI